MWAGNIRALAAVYRTIAVDQLGHIGATVYARAVRRMSDLLDWLNQLFDGLKLSGPTAQYALHFPERVGKTILLAPGGAVLRIRPTFIGRLMLAAMAPRWRARIRAGSTKRSNCCSP